MPRIRSYKPEFFKSADVAALPYRARLTWLGLWVQADDHGRWKDDPRLVKSDVWPLDDDVSVADCALDLAVLAKHGRVVRYASSAGIALLAVTNWHHHQQINRPSPPRFEAPPMPVGVPAPGEARHCPVCWAAEMAAHGALTEDSRGKGKERKGKEGNARERDVAPSRYCLDHPEGTRDPCGACARAREAHKAWAAAGRRPRNLPTSHDFVDDGSGTCVTCPLPPEHSVHSRLP